MYFFYQRNKTVWEIIKNVKTINHFENANKCYNEIPLIPVSIILWSRHKFLSTSSVNCQMLGPVCGDLENVGRSGYLERIHGFKFLCGNFGSLGSWKHTRRLLQQFLKEKVIKSLKEIQVKENHWNEMNTTVEDMKWK